MDEDVPRFEALIEDVNISGREPCTDELYRGRFELYQRFDPPFVYTPGDNDWFDCVRESQGGYDEYERMEKVGMTREGVLRMNRIERGEAVDEARFSILRRAWL